MTEYQEANLAAEVSIDNLYVCWRFCEQLAQELAEECRTLKTGKWSHASEESILAFFFDWQIRRSWTTVSEARWTIQRAANLLGWPAPPVAMAPEPISKKRLHKDL